MYLISSLCYQCDKIPYLGKKFLGPHVHFQVPSYIFLFYCRTMPWRGPGGLPCRKEGTYANSRPLLESSDSSPTTPPCSSAKSRPAASPPSTAKRCLTRHGVSATAKPVTPPPHVRWLWRRLQSTQPTAAWSSVQVPVRQLRTWRHSWRGCYFVWTPSIKLKEGCIGGNVLSYCFGAQ